MNDESRPQADPQPPTPSPETPASPAKPKTEIQPSILILGAIVIGLLVLLIFSNSKPAPREESEELRAAKEALRQIENQSATQSGKLNLPPGLPENEIADAEAVAKRLAEDSQTLIAFSRGARDLLASRDSLLADRSKEITQLLAGETSLRQELDRLKKERDQALVEASTANTALQQLKEAQTRIVVLSEQLQKATQAPVELEKSLAALTAERDALAAKVRDLENQISQANLFADNEQELLKESVQLFHSLQGLEGQPDSDVAAAYSKFGANLGATVITRMEFPVGESNLEPQQLERIQAFSREAPPQAIFFVVGYASKTGDADANRTLSSKRATSVARALLDVRQPSQRVQAAYLGPTDRFGSKFPERNQICEIWQILPRP